MTYGWFTDWLARRMADWLARCMAVWLTDSHPLTWPVCSCCCYSQYRLSMTTTFISVYFWLHVSAFWEAIFRQLAVHKERQFKYNLTYWYCIFQMYMYIYIRGVVLTTHPLQAPRSRMSRAIPRLPLWAFGDGYRANFTYIYIYISQQSLLVQFTLLHVSTLCVTIRQLHIFCLLCYTSFRLQLLNFIKLLLLLLLLQY
jgi:hypothetical protein